MDLDQSNVLKHQYNSMYQTSDEESGPLRNNEQVYAVSTTRNPKVLNECNPVERHGFVAKVLFIVLVQILLTCGITAAFIMSTNVKQTFYRHPGFAWLAIIFSFIFLLILVCCQDIARQAPANYCLLFGFTLCEGILLGIISSLYDTEAVLLAGLITIAVASSLILFAAQTKYDVTGMGGYALSALVVLIVAGFIRLFICQPGQCELVEIIFAAIGALIFSFLLVYDIQLIVGGDRQFQFNTDDYVIAALSIYLDVINLFLMLLELVGIRSQRA